MLFAYGERLKNILFITTKLKEYKLFNIKNINTT